MRRTIDRSAIGSKAAPLFAGLLSKLVLEVLPASLASVIGAVLLAHYQFGQPAVPAAVAAAPPVVASPQMLRLVRDEHDLIRDFLIAQQAEQANRYAAAEAQPAQAPADTALAVEPASRVATVVAAKAPAPVPRVKTAALAAPVAAPSPVVVMPAAAPAPQALPAVADLQNSAAPPPPAPAEHPTLMARIMAVKDHVVHAPLNAVMTIGGIPSWIGRRLGSDDANAGERMFSAAS